MAANPELREQLEQALAGNGVLLLMKGTPEAPRCGFSMRTVGVLEQVGVEYGAIDVLPVLAPLREVTAERSDWETFPQLYVNGELVGGCDIVEEMFESGELAEMLGVEQPEAVVTGAPRGRRRRASPEPADADRDLSLAGPDRPWALSSVARVAPLRGLPASYPSAARTSPSGQRWRARIDVRRWRRPAPARRRRGPGRRSRSHRPRRRSGC